MTQSRYHPMRHVQRVRQHFTCEVDDAAFGALAQWAEQANAVCFLADGSVRDPQGRVLISQGEPAIDDDAQVPYPPNALQRRAQQLALLTAQGIRVPPSLSPVPGEAEVRVRDAAVVIQRMLALFAVALRAEMLAAGDTPPSLDEVDARLPSGARPRRRHRSVVGARAVRTRYRPVHPSSPRVWRLVLAGRLDAGTADLIGDTVSITACRGAGRVITQLPDQPKRTRRRCRTVRRCHRSCRTMRPTDQAPAASSRACNAANASCMSATVASRLCTRASSSLVSLPLRAPGAAHAAAACSASTSSSPLSRCA